jgi:hypothetical protein
MTPLCMSETKTSLNTIRNKVSEECGHEKKRHGNHFSYVQDFCLDCEIIITPCKKFTPKGEDDD